MDNSLITNPLLNAYYAKEEGPDLEIFGIYEAAVPNKEHIVFRVTRPNVDLTYLGLILAIKLASGAAVPLVDHFFWFGNGVLNQGDWIFLYTRRGHRSVSTVQGDPTHNIYNLYWGRQNVVFDNSDVVPLLFKFDSITIGKAPSLPSNNPSGFGLLER